MTAIVVRPELDRANLGRMLRQASIDVNLTLETCKPDYLIPYDKLPKGDQEYHNEVAAKMIAYVLDAMEGRELLKDVIRAGDIIAH